MTPRLNKPHLNRVLLLQTGFRYRERPALFARARLYPDRIELSDWGRHGQFNRRIALSDVDHVEWSASNSTANIILVLNEGERIALRLKQVNRWREALEQRLRWDAQQARRRLDLPLNDLVAYTTSMS